MKKIPPFELKPVPLNAEAAALPGFQWAPDDVGTRHRLGGAPQFLQEPTIPRCLDCDEEMIFYAQLDSINDEFCIADCGMIFVFVCLECNTVIAEIQSY